MLHIWECSRIGVWVPNPQYAANKAQCTEAVPPKLDKLSKIWGSSDIHGALAHFNSATSLSGNNCWVFINLPSELTCHQSTVLRNYDFELATVTTCWIRAFVRKFCSAVGRGIGRVKLFLIKPWNVVSFKPQGVKQFRQYIKHLSSSYAQITSVSQNSTGAYDKHLHTTAFLKRHSKTWLDEWQINPHFHQIFRKSVHL